MHEPDRDTDDGEMQQRRQGELPTREIQTVHEIAPQRPGADTGAGVGTLDGVVVNSASDIIVAVNQAQDSGVLLGWLSVAAVLIALALGLPVRA